jgi:hypothetical protein
MQRTVVAMVALTVVVAPLAIGAATGLISATSIAGAKPGGAEDDYASFLGANARIEPTLRRNRGFSRFVSHSRRAAVYFKKKTGAAVVITTWNKTDRTAAGVGPCSPIATLKKVYGGRLKPSKTETYASGVYAYRLGNLIFGAAGSGRPSKRVTAVGLYADVTEAAATDFTLAFERAVC